MIPERILWRTNCVDLWLFTLRLRTSHLTLRTLNDVGMRAAEKQNGISHVGRSGLLWTLFCACEWHSVFLKLEQMKRAILEHTRSGDDARNSLLNAIQEVLKSCQLYHSMTIRGANLANTLAGSKSYEYLPFLACLASLSNSLSFSPLYQTSQVLGDQISFTSGLSPKLYTELWCSNKLYKKALVLKWSV